MKGKLFFHTHIEWHSTDDLGQVALDIKLQMSATHILYSYSLLPGQRQLQVNRTTKCPPVEMSQITRDANGWHLYFSDLWAQPMTSHIAVLSRLMSDPAGLDLLLTTWLKCLRGSVSPCCLTNRPSVTIETEPVFSRADPLLPPYCVLIWVRTRRRDSHSTVACFRLSFISERAQTSHVKTQAVNNLPHVSRCFLITVTPFLRSVRRHASLGVHHVSLISSYSCLVLKWQMETFGEFLSLTTPNSPVTCPFPSPKKGITTRVGKGRQS